MFLWSVQGRDGRALLLSAGKFIIKKPLLGVPASFQCQTWWWGQGFTIPTTDHIFERSLQCPTGIAIPVSQLGLLVGSVCSKSVWLSLCPLELLQLGEGHRRGEGVSAWLALITCHHFFKGCSRFKVLGLSNRPGRTLQRETKAEYRAVNAVTKEVSEFTTFWENPKCSAYMLPLKGKCPLGYIFQPSFCPLPPIFF